MTADGFVDSLPFPVSRDAVACAAERSAIASRLTESLHCGKRLHGTLPTRRVNRRRRRTGIADARGGCGTGSEAVADRAVVRGDSRQAATAERPHVALLPVSPSHDGLRGLQDRL